MMHENTSGALPVPFGGNEVMVGSFIASKLAGGSKRSGGSSTWSGLECVTLGLRGTSPRPIGILMAATVEMRGRLLRRTK